MKNRDMMLVAEGLTKKIIKPFSKLDFKEEKLVSDLKRFGPYKPLVEFLPAAAALIGADSAVAGAAASTGEGAAASAGEAIAAGGVAKGSDSQNSGEASAITHPAATINSLPTTGQIDV